MQQIVEIGCLVAYNIAIRAIYTDYRQPLRVAQRHIITILIIDGEDDFPALVTNYLNTKFCT